MNILYVPQYLLNIWRNSKNIVTGNAYSHDGRYKLNEQKPIVKNKNLLNVLVEMKE